MALSARLQQIVARLKDERFDTSPPCLPSEIEALRLSTTRLQVDDQRPRAGRTHRHARGGHPSERRLTSPPQRVTRGRSKQSEQQEQRAQHQQPLPMDRQHHDQTGSSEDRDHRAYRAQRAALCQSEPDGSVRQQNEPDREHSDRNVTRQRDGSHHNHRGGGDERKDRGDTPQHGALRGPVCLRSHRRSGHGSHVPRSLQPNRALRSTVLLFSGNYRCSSVCPDYSLEIGSAN